MTENEFWSLIDEARLKAGTPQSIPAWLEARLAERSPADILDFGAWLAMFMGQAHNASLWNAGSIIARGLSDDGFVYFKCWLIAQGKTVYEAAILNPDSLADLEYPDDESDRGFAGRPKVSLEGLLHTYLFAYNKNCGKQKYAALTPPDDWTPPSGCLPYGELPKVKPQDLLGSDAVPEKTAMFPRLTRRFPTRTPGRG